MSKTKIGITIDFQGSPFSNGIQQNSIFLSSLLREAGYKTTLIFSDSSKIEKAVEFIKDLDFTTLQNSFSQKWDLIISIGFGVEITHFDTWSKMNPELKLVSYQCGNKFLINLERILFNKGDNSRPFHHSKTQRMTPHQVWTIPQMEKTCYNIYQFIENQEKVTVVPFIWSPEIIEKSFKLKGYKDYTPREIKRCSVLEPNTSVMKNIFHPVISLEKNQKVNPLKEIYLFGSNIISDSLPFHDFIKSTDIYLSGVATIEPRVAIHDVLNRYTDFVLSWQWENNLNYLWLDCIWKGWPVIHNGEMCSDIGYYYSSFDADECVEKIGEVINHHNDNLDIYLKGNSERILRFTEKNQNLIKQYTSLVEDVLSDKFTRRKYCSKENSVI